MKPAVRILLLLTLLLASCAGPADSSRHHSPWEYTHLRAIDPPDPIAPAMDIAAVYLRTESGDFQVRVDLLDLSPDSAIAIHFLIDHAPAGSHPPPGIEPASFAWDTWITAGTAGISITRAGGQAPSGYRARLERSPASDSIVLSLDAAVLGVNALGGRVVVFTSLPGSTVPLDFTVSVSTSGSPPAPVPLLLAFWNTMPAATPSQAVRSWDGAHTGPFNNRHGLAHLLKASLSTSVPLTLLDLKTPAALSALSITRTSLLDDALRQGLVTLPDFIPISGGNPLIPASAWAQAESLEDSRQAGQTFGLFQAQNLPGALAAPAFPLALFESSAQAAPLVITYDAPPSSSSLVECRRWQQSVVIQLPAETLSPTLQTTSESGLSLDFKRELLLAAASFSTQTGFTDPCLGSIAFLGGDFSLSPLGDPQSAQAALSYISTHPWLRPLHLSDFGASTPSQTYRPSPGSDPLDLPLFTTGGSPVPGELTVSSLHTQIIAQFQALPAGHLKETAWSMYTALASPSACMPAKRCRLSAGYLPQIGLLLAGASWESDLWNPAAACQPNSVCTVTLDLNWDGEPETILASSGILAILEPRGAYLAALFTRDSAGAHQVVAPGWQFIAGVGDPLTWQPDHGIASDPLAWRGAFSDTPAGFTQPSWDRYTQQALPGEVTFSSPDGSLQKTFSLTSTGIEVQYRSAVPLDVQIPLAIDPWERFMPGWWKTYLSSAAMDGWTLRAGASPNVILTGKAGSQGQLDMTMRSFTDPANLFPLPEDPFRDYGPAYFFPFPFTLIRARILGPVSFDLSLFP